MLLEYAPILLGKYQDLLGGYLSFPVIPTAIMIKKGKPLSCLFALQPKNVRSSITVCILMLSGQEFSHPVESLALTVDEVINVRRVLVKAEMEKFLQKKELYNNLKKGKVTWWTWTVLSILFCVQ